MTALDALERLGQPQPIPRSELDTAGVTWPAPLRDLLEGWGAGTLGGRFRVLAPGASRFLELLAFVRGPGRQKHARGWWKLCTTLEWDQLAVFAEGQRGDVLAFGRERLFWLGPRGESVVIGRSLQNLASFLDSATVRDFYGEPLPATYLVGAAGAGAATPRDRMLEALRAGDNAKAERIFEELIGSDDPTTALLGLIRALAAETAVTDELRDDWRGTATQMLKRRLGKDQFAKLDLSAEPAMEAASDAQLRWERGAPPRPWIRPPVTIDAMEREWREAGDPSFDVDALIASVMAIPDEHRREALVTLDTEAPSLSTLLKLTDCVPLYALALRQHAAVIDPLCAAPIAQWRAVLRSWLFHLGPSEDAGWVWSHRKLPKQVTDEFLAVLAENPPAQQLTLCLQALSNEFHDDRVFAVLRDNRAERPQPFAIACEQRKERSAIPALWDIARPAGSYDYSVIKALAALGDEQAEKILARLDRAHW